MNKQIFSPRCAAMALGLACAAAAQAQLAPFGVTVGETVSHQSNIFRAPAGSETADWLSNTTLRGTFDQAFGRQRAKAFAGVDAGYYKNKTDLNHVGHQVGAEFDWSTVSKDLKKAGFSFVGTTIASAASNWAGWRAGRCGVAWTRWTAATRPPISPPTR